MRPLRLPERPPIAIQMVQSETQAGNGFEAVMATEGTVIQPSDATQSAGFGVTGLNLAPGGKLDVTAGTTRPYTLGAGAMIGIVLRSAQDTLYLGDVAGPAAPAPPPPPPTPTSVTPRRATALTSSSLSTRPC